MLRLNVFVNALRADSFGNKLLIVSHQCDTIGFMPSVNMRQLRDTRKLKAWLSAGKTVELRERDKLIAKIVPQKQEPTKPPKWPDFETRAKEVLGDRILPNVLLEDRGRY